ncbi:MAG: hypothetical protein LUM44_05890 [Pyrinomonadaceae bacterium]|nr:hypothetical protein [Pyrinomonadaceae bacterium]
MNFGLCPTMCGKAVPFRFAFPCFSRLCLALKRLKAQPFAEVGSVSLTES